MKAREAEGWRRVGRQWFRSQRFGTLADLEKAFPTLATPELVANSSGGPTGVILGYEVSLSLEGAGVAGRHENFVVSMLVNDAATTSGLKLIIIGKGRLGEVSTWRQMEGLLALEAARSLNRPRPSKA